METFSALLALCEGNSPVTGESPHKGQWRGALMFSLICAWINGWANTPDAGGLGRHRAHYDVTVMAVPLSSRTCKNGVCGPDKEVFQEEHQECNDQLCVCTLTPEAYADVTGATGIPVGTVVGVIELDEYFDGVPTALGEDLVKIGDPIQANQNISFKKSPADTCGQW